MLSEEIQTRVWRAAELTLSQVRALRRLADEPKPLGQLGLELGLAPPSITRLADRLDGTTSALLSGARVSETTLRQVALSCLNRWRDGLAEARPAMAAVIAVEWIQQLGELETDLEGPVAQATEVARVPWWR